MAKMKKVLKKKVKYGHEGDRFYKVDPETGLRIVVGTGHFSSFGACCGGRILEGFYAASHDEQGIADYAAALRTLRTPGVTIAVTSESQAAAEEALALAGFSRCEAQGRNINSGNLLTVWVKARRA